MSDSHLDYLISPMQYLFDTVREISVLPCAHTIHLDCVKEMENIIGKAFTSIYMLPMKDLNGVHLHEFHHAVFCYEAELIYTLRQSSSFNQCY